MGLPWWIENFISGHNKNCKLNHSSLSDGVSNVGVSVRRSGQANEDHQGDVISATGMGGYAVLSDLDVRADCDIHRSKIIGRLVTFTRSKTILHHHIIRSRRLGTRHGELGFGESGIDVIRHATPRAA